MANQALHHRQLRIGPMHSSVKRCRSIKDRNRRWKVGVRDLVRDICCALHHAGFVFPRGSQRFNRDNLICTPGVDYICRQVQRQLLRNESARFYHHRTRKCIPPRKS